MLKLRIVLQIYPIVTRWERLNLLGLHKTLNRSTGYKAAKLQQPSAAIKTIECLNN